MRSTTGAKLAEAAASRHPCLDWNSLKVMLAVGRLLASGPGLRKVDGGAVVELVDRGWRKGATVEL